MTKSTPQKLYDLENISLDSADNVGYAAKKIESQV
jgi:hypothetical protein